MGHRDTPSSRARDPDPRLRARRLAGRPGAWITEKYWAWTDHDGDPTSALSRDQMLDNITLYWLTATAASSARLYWESGWARPSGQSQMASAGHDHHADGNLDLPARDRAAVAAVVREALPRPSLLRAPDRGGHFAAWEQPELFVDQVRRAFRTMR